MKPTYVCRGAVRVRLAALLIAAFIAAAPNASRAEIAGLQTVQDRPEFRSYGRTPGLGIEGVPAGPPAQRGVRLKRPVIITPSPVAPTLGRPGAPRPFSRQWYRYCARTYRSFEPRTGRYTTYSGEERLCS